jgi:hypothetical protein
MLGLAVPHDAAARTITGRITSYSATSVSVLDKEILTVALDEQTSYTKLVTQKPWQESGRLSAGALAVGRLAVVHVRRDDPDVADWVAIATDVPLVVPARTAATYTSADHLRLQQHYLALAAKYRAEADQHAVDARVFRDHPSFLASKNPIGPGTAVHCDRLAAQARDAAREAEDMASAHEHLAEATK